MDVSPSSIDIQMANTYSTCKPAYKLNIYETVADYPREIIFNELEGVHKFMKEVLNRKYVKVYISYLREDKRCTENHFGKNHKDLYSYYGDVDTPLHSVEEMRKIILEDLVYEYRLGTSNVNFMDEVGYLRMRVTLYR